MSLNPDLTAALIALAGGALLVAGWRAERSTLTPTTETTEGTDGADALPAEDL